MLELLNNTVSFWGTTLSFVDLVGAIVGIAYVILEYKASRWMWPCSIVMSLCVIFSCYVNKLYANGAINVYYLVMGIYGIYSWNRMRKESSQQQDKEVSDDDNMQSLSLKGGLWTIGLIVCLTAAVYWLLHGVGENDVVLGIDLTILDALTAAISIVATWLLVHKYYQQWICWIVVNPITAIMFCLAGSYPLAVMYIIYSLVSIFGYRRWKQSYLKNNQ